MGRIKICAYGNCKSDTRTLKDNSIYFIPFPKPKTNLSKCLAWIERCGRLDEFGVENIKRNSFVCSLHFASGKGPTEENPELLDFRETKEYNVFKEKWYGESCKIPFNPPITFKEECLSPTGSQETLSAASDLEELVKSEDELVSGISEGDCSSTVIKDEVLVTVKLEEDQLNLAQDEPQGPSVMGYQLLSYQPVHNASTSSFVSFLDELPTVLPKKWALSYNKESNEVKFVKMGSDDASIVLSIKITLPSEEEPEQCLELKALNHLIPIQHRATLVLNQYFSNCSRMKIDEVGHALRIFDQFNPCLGLGGLELVEEFQSSPGNINGFYCWQDNALHSHKCEFLIINSSHLCNECKKIKLALKKRIYRKRKNPRNLNARDSDLSN